MVAILAALGVLFLTRFFGLAPWKQLLLLLCSPVLVTPWAIQNRFTEYYIDNLKGLVGTRAGILVRTDTFIRFSDIKSASSRQTLVQRFCGCTSLALDSVGDDAPEVIWDWIEVDTATRIRELIARTSPEGRPRGRWEAL